MIPKNCEEFFSHAAKLWLAHDGLWFLEVEKKFGIDIAIELDKNAWRQFTVIEAKRIKKLFNISEKGGIEALKKALKCRLYAFINEQEIIEIDDKTIELRMISCRVQEARKRKNLQPFPCKEVGLIEYKFFAETIDNRIETTVVNCPPDPKPPTHWCAWRFHIK